MAGVDFTTVVAGVLAVIILVDISVLVIAGQPVPELLSNLAFSVFGFYFGRRAPATRPVRVRDAAGASVPPLPGWEPAGRDASAPRRAGRGSE